MKIQNAKIWNTKYENHFRLLLNSPPSSKPSHWLLWAFFKPFWVLRRRRHWCCIPCPRGMSTHACTPTHTYKHTNTNGHINPKKGCQPVFSQHFPRKRENTVESHQSPKPTSKCEHFMTSCKYVGEIISENQRQCKWVSPYLVVSSREVGEMLDHTEWFPKQAPLIQITDTQTQTPPQGHASTEKHGKIGNKLCHIGKTVSRTKLDNNNSTSCSFESHSLQQNISRFFHFCPIRRKPIEKENHFHENSREELSLGSCGTRVWLRSSSTVAAAARPPPTSILGLSSPNLANCKLLSRPFLQTTGYNCLLRSVSGT